MSAEVGRRSLSLAVDASKPDSLSIKGNQLDVEKRLYLGGLPHAHPTRRINVGSSTAVNHSFYFLSVVPTLLRPFCSQVSSSFQGCVHSVRLNGAILDLSKPASRHNVTSCFSSEQAGSYFNGSGYGVFSQSDTPPSHLSSHSPSQPV